MAEHIMFEGFMDFYADLIKKGLQQRPSTHRFVSEEEEKAILQRQNAGKICPASGEKRIA